MTSIYDDSPTNRFLRSEGIIDDIDEPVRCRGCGCTDDEPCEGGCSWVPDPVGMGELCSRCVDVLEEEAMATEAEERRAQLDSIAGADTERRLAERLAAPPRTTDSVD